MVVKFTSRFLVSSLLLGGLLLTPVIARHAVAADAGYQTISAMHFNPSWPGVLVKYADTMVSVPNCRTDWYWLRTTHSQYQEIYSLLLAAHLANKKVRIDVATCELDPEKKSTAIPVIKHIWF